MRRLEAQRNDLNAKVRLLREELQLLQEQGSHVGEVIKPMDKKKVLVKVCESALFPFQCDEKMSGCDLRFILRESLWWIWTRV